MIYQKYIIDHSIDQNILFTFIWTLSTVSVLSFQTLEFPKHWKYLLMIIWSLVVSSWNLFSDINVKWVSFTHNTPVSTTIGFILMRRLLKTPKDRLVSRQPNVNRGFNFQSHPLIWPPGPLLFLVLSGWDWRYSPSNQVGSPDNPSPQALGAPKSPHYHNKRHVNHLSLGNSKSFCSSVTEMRRKKNSYFLL